MKKVTKQVKRARSGCEQKKTRVDPANSTVVSFLSQLLGQPKISAVIEIL